MRPGVAIKTSGAGVAPPSAPALTFSRKSSNKNI